jgi:hypothetical protein
MAENFTCSHSLRVLGQALDKIGADVFEIRSRNDHFYLQCGDPTPPHLAIMDFSYTSADIRALDIQARAERQESFKFVDFSGLAEILRAVGRHIESAEGRLLRVCNFDAASGQDCIRVEYQTRDGRTYVEELSTAIISDYAMRMYKDRARIQQDHAHR